MDEILKEKSLVRDKQIANSFVYKHFIPAFKNDNSIARKGVLFIEDANSGFEFICEYIKACYSDIDITVVSVGGSGNFRFAYAFDIENKYDYAIFMYDRGKASPNGEDNNII